MTVLCSPVGQGLNAVATDSQTFAQLFDEDFYCFTDLPPFTGCWQSDRV